MLRTHSVSLCFLNICSVQFFHGNGKRSKCTVVKRFVVSSNFRFRPRAAGETRQKIWEKKWKALKRSVLFIVLVCFFIVVIHSCHWSGIGQGRIFLKVREMAKL